MNMLTQENSTPNENREYCFGYWLLTKTKILNSIIHKQREIIMAKLMKETMETKWLKLNL